MLPGTVLAGTLLLSLVPGWLFLRLTERVRRPRNTSDLHELVELVAVGVGTTGLAGLAAAVFRAEGIHELTWPPTGPADIRELGLSFGAVLAASLALAVAGALLVRWRSPTPTASLVTSVWWDVLRADAVPSGHVPYVSLRLRDGHGSVEGVLDAFTWQVGVEMRRDISLRPPIRFPAGVSDDGKVLYRKPGYDRLVVDGDMVQEIALRYVPR